MSAGTLITATELSARIDAGSVLVVDCRKDLATPDSGALAYALGHIPTAVYADLDTDLSDLGKRGLGRHPLPDAVTFSGTLSRWGWHAGMSIVAYDDAGGALAAARLWWMMRLSGSTEAAVLDGGFGAWRALGFAETSVVPERSASNVDIRFDSAMLPDYAALARGLDEGSVVLLDARAAPRFRGDVEPLDPVAGHVPGALNRPFAANLDAQGRFKAPAPLRDEFRAIMGTRAPTDVVHMCGSGVTACHNLLAMEHAGLAGSRVFAPSWSGWVSDRSRPVQSVGRG